MATLRSPRAGTVDECHGHTSLELAAALCDAYDGGCGGVTAAIADGVTYYQTRAARETVVASPPRPDADATHAQVVQQRRVERRIIVL